MLFTAAPCWRLPQILGGDVAGVVEEADAGSAFKPGDKVFCLTPGWVPAERSNTRAAFGPVLC